MYMILYDASTNKDRQHRSVYNGIVPSFTDEKNVVANYLSQYELCKVYKLDSLTEITSAEINLLEGKSA